MSPIYVRLMTLLLIMTSSTVAIAKAMPEFGGDLRFRNERIDQDANDARFRQRVRGRLSAKGNVENTVDYQIRFTTGSSDPTSGNQTLDTGFSSKGAQFDILSLTYNFKKIPLKIIAGKIKNPFFRPGKTALVWDGDVTPEGIVLNGELGVLFANLGYLYAEERSGEPDTAIHSAQAGVDLNRDNWRMKTALSFYEYTAIKGRSGLFDSTSTFGNSSTSVAGNEVFNKNFGIAEIGMQFDLKAMKLSFFTNAVKNTATSKAHSGYLAGFSYGSKFKFKYSYRRLESDAVLGVFTDSDFKGGGTDTKGHKLGLGYNLTKKQKLGLTQYINKTSLQNGQDYYRTMLDYSIKF